MKEVLLLKNGALKVHAGVGMDLVQVVGELDLLLPVIIRNPVLFECSSIMRVHEHVRAVMLINTIIWGILIVMIKLIEICLRVIVIVTEHVALKSAV